MSSGVPAYEKLGAFYLGRPHDPESGETLDQPLLYDSKDLLTHGVCVGMTGSGKTGLCISLLEEAAIDGIPALVIDVKGDLGNLLLNFPDLRPEDFRPWVDPAEADRRGQDVEEFAADQAKLWKEGLAKWDQGGERLRRLQDAAELAIYTPGSEAGLPVSILSSFAAPPENVVEDNDLLQERISTTVSGLLGLLGIEADPLRSREHILLANLLDHTWREGRDLDMAGLIRSLQDPPMETIGVMPLDSFYPKDDRFELAMAINNLLAAPGFASWLSGTPLDVDKLLYTESGKPRMAIFSIAHLNDAERMFFVSLLLNQALGWMRGLSGTSSLRALLYMDEVFGYLPPISNPPSKQPLLTMLKQARAFGFGLLLATQNPVDLDYKALSNIGTWFLGRLQTERDKERVLAGLEGAAGGPDRRTLERLLSGLDKRVFLLHNVHEREPVTFRVRWAMSYLRGPLTRNEIQRLMEGREETSADAAPAARKVAAAGGEGERPLLPPEVSETFLPCLGSPRDIVYRPHLLGEGRVHFIDSRRDIQSKEEVLLLADLEDEVGDVDWYAAQALDLSPDHLEDEPAPEAAFGQLPPVAGKEKSYRSWNKAFSDTLYRGRRLKLWKSPTYKETSRPEESERDFRIRLGQLAREKRDEQTEKLRAKYDKKLETAGDRIRRAEQKVEVQAEQARDQKLKTVVDIGSSLLGAFLSRRRSLSSRIGTAVKGYGRQARESQDVERAKENLAVLEEKYRALERELEEEIEALEERFDPQNEELEVFAVKPRRADVEVRRVVLAWAPYRKTEEGLEEAWG